MPEIVTKPRARTRLKIARPPLFKVILVNDDFTPRDFVVTVLKAEFRMTAEQALKVMLTAHQKGSCVVAVFTREIAETKATRATEMARGDPPLPQFGRARYGFLTLPQSAQQLAQPHNRKAENAVFESPGARRRPYLAPRLHRRSRVRRPG